MNEYNLKDVFGNLVPFDKASQAARSNLMSQYTNDEVNKMLGSATGAQIGDWAKGVNLSGGYGTNTNALTLPTINGQQPPPLYATSDLESEAKRIQEARNAAYEAQAATQREEARKLQVKEAGYAEAMGGKGGKGGGFDTIISDQIEATKKTLAKNIADIDAALVNAKLNNDTATFDQISKIRQQASDAYYQALTASIQQEQLKLQQLTAGREQTESDFKIISSLPMGESVTINGKTYTGIAQPTTETQAFTDNEGNVTIIDKNTGQPIGTIPGIGEAKAKNMEFREVNGRIFIFDPATGITTDTKISVPKQSVAGSGTGFDYNVIKSQLDATKGQDGFVNTDKYKELRMSVKDKTTFDKNYSYMLNPKDQSAKEFFTQAELKSTVDWGQPNPDTGKTPEQAFLELGVSQDMIDMAKSTGITPSELMK